jgi:hypothetical protein
MPWWIRGEEGKKKGNPIKMKVGAESGGQEERTVRRGYNVIDMKIEKEEASGSRE